MNWFALIGILFCLSQALVVPSGLAVYFEVLAAFNAVIFVLGIRREIADREAV